MKKLSHILILLFIVTGAWATHNRAGEIVFRRISDSNPFLYEITVITYTKWDPGGGSQSNEADRCSVEVFFGHNNTSAEVPRSNGTTNTLCDGNGMDGEVIDPLNEIKKNEYKVIHEFPGPGTFTVSMEDPNRNSGIENIPNSVQVPFYIQSKITVDQLSGGNNAPILQNPPIDNGCVKKIFEHNPGAVDPDGDSLVYNIIPCRGGNGEVINGYSYPDDINPSPSNNLSIDTRTGDLVWDSPQARGEYNVCIRIDEYRRNPNSGKVILVGSITRDMQITIGICEEDPPEIDKLARTCVTAGETVVRTVTATDPQDDPLELTGVGYPLEADNPASFTDVTGDSPLSSVFEWQTNCDNIQRQPYWMYFKAKQDNNTSVELVDFETFEILVVAPPVQITSLEPAGKNMSIKWSVSSCPKAEGYDIYRFNDSLGYVAPECITGMPEQLGYQHIGSTDGLNSTSFLDDNGGQGLTHGQLYCYMIVVRYPDGSESYPSLEACGELIRDVPILNKVSVIETDSANGADSVSWYKPVDLKTSVYGPPYRYQLSRSTSASGPFEVVYTGPESNDFLSLDTFYLDEGLNTRDEQHYYEIVLLSKGEKTGNSRAAASVFLTSKPGDNKLRLRWDVDVPWTNHRYVVYRFSNDPDSLDTFHVLDTVETTSYLDQNLANLREYRYFVQSIGRYSSEALPDTLFNKSQIHTGIPVDNEIPCPPQAPFIDGDCTLDENMLAWDNPNLVCDTVDDVVAYRIYYADRLGKPLTLLETIDDPNTTEFRHFNEGSIAGCYAVTAIDSFDNESEYSSSLCVDNCPDYRLPNVFTPGGDGLNDYFTPFPYKFVESISIRIYNRWGELLFETTDPDINWNGTNQSNGREVPDGVYYYDCVVNEIRLVGIVQRELRGYVHLIREKGPSPQAN